MIVTFLLLLLDGARVDLFVFGRMLAWAAMHPLALLGDLLS
jgi:hypothetical protein